MHKTVYPVIGSEKRLPFYLTGIGISDPEYHVERENGLVSHQFLLTLEGTGILETDGTAYELKKDSIFYLAPCQPHKYYPADKNWKTAWIVFRGSELSEIMPRLGFQPFMTAQLLDSSQFMQLFDMIYAAAQDSINGSERSSALIYEMILSVRRCFAGQEHMDKTSGLCEKTVRFIDENYSYDITLQQLADNAGISEQHLCRIFKSVMGMRPVEYISRRRIAQSKLLLLNSERSIEEIARTVGYSGSTYFGMVFKKYEGISPGGFRKTSGGITL